jgi:hypothetical protein
VSDPLRYPVGRFARPEQFSLTESRLHVDELRELPTVLRRMVADLTERQLDTTYRDGGWTVRQVVHHMADSHLNAYVRVRRALTETGPTVQAYDENAWAHLPDASNAPVVWSLDLLDGLHARWTTLLAALDAAGWQRQLHHPDFDAPLTVWSIAALYAWHGRHHVAHIAALRTRNGW